MRFQRYLSTSRRARRAVVVNFVLGFALCAVDFPAALTLAAFLGSFRSSASRSSFGVGLLLGFPSVFLFAFLDQLIQIFRNVQAIGHGRLLREKNALAGQNGFNIRGLFDGEFDHGLALDIRLQFVFQRFLHGGQQDHFLGRQEVSASDFRVMDRR
jgi:hypothetical protein